MCLLSRFRFSFSVSNSQNGEVGAAIPLKIFIILLIMEKQYSTIDTDYFVSQYENTIGKRAFSIWMKISFDSLLDIH